MLLGCVNFRLMSWRSEFLLVHVHKMGCHGGLGLLSAFGSDSIQIWQLFEISSSL